MIGILINYDLIAIPIPARDDIVIVRSDVPVEIVKPEAITISAAEHEHMLRSEAAVEMAMRPGMIGVVMEIITPSVVSKPPIVVRVHVRHVGMTLPVGLKVVLLNRPPTAVGGALPYRGLSPGGRRSVSRDVSTSEFGMAAAAIFPSSLLRKSRDAKQNR